MVSGDNGDVLDAAYAQAPDNLRHLRPHRSAQFQCTAECIVHSHHHHRVAFAMSLFQRFLGLRRERDALHIHEAAAADADQMAVDANADAITHLVLHGVAKGSSSPSSSAFSRMASAIG